MSFDPPTDHLTLADLSPPYPDYLSFDGSGLTSLRACYSEYSPVNACRLAEASLLAYGDPKSADRLRDGTNLLTREGVHVARVAGPDDAVPLFNHGYAILDLDVRKAKRVWHADV